MPTNAKAKIRYAVVGLGYISQSRVLPAFANAKGNSELTALVSGDPKKLRQFGKKYGVDKLYSYRQYEQALQEVDAVYIATPNTLHLSYTVRAARAGVHVLCEKPLAASVADCRAMIRACDDAGVKLMTSYRLHFDPANLNTVEVVKSGKIGDLQVFGSLFSMQVEPDNIRTKKHLGGGPLLDIGVYCINAARYLFRGEPREVSCLEEGGGQKRFRQVPRTVSAILRFDGGRLATFSCSFGAADAAKYWLVGTKGALELNRAYEISERIEQTITIDDRPKLRRFPKTEQFGPVLSHFSECILNDRKPEPSGEEGLADLLVVEALEESARRGKTVRVLPETKKQRPDSRQAARKKVREKGKLYRAVPAHR